MQKNKNLVEILCVRDFLLGKVNNIKDSVFLMPFDFQE